VPRSCSSLGLELGRRAGLALPLLLAGCGGGEAAKPDEAPATVPLRLPTTAEQILTGDPEPPATEVEPPTTAEPTTTTLASGLPSGLGIPGAGNISLGGGSQISNGFTVREVPFADVVAFVRAELVALGWELPPDDGGAGGAEQVVLRFAGPGAVGQAQIEARADGTVHVGLVLQAG
jgi:hypothetical protein